MDGENMRGSQAEARETGFETWKRPRQTDAECGRVFVENWRKTSNCRVRNSSCRAINKSR